MNPARPWRGSKTISGNKREPKESKVLECMDQAELLLQGNHWNGVWVSKKIAPSSCKISAVFSCQWEKIQGVLSIRTETAGHPFCLVIMGLAFTTNNSNSSQASKSPVFLSSPSLHCGKFQAQFSPRMKQVRASPALPQQVVTAWLGLSLLLRGRSLSSYLPADFSWGLLGIFFLKVHLLPEKLATQMALETQYPHTEGDL